MGASVFGVAWNRASRGLWLAIVCGLAPIAPAVAEPEITLATQEWAPYQTEAGGRRSGIAIDALRCVLDRMGETYHLVFLPWRRAQEEVRAGRVDGFFAASRSAERDEYAVFSTPIAPQVWAWYFPRGTSLRPGDAAFKATAKVSATSGSNMASWLARSGYRMDGETRTLEQLVTMLRARRVDAVLANALTFDEAVRSLGQSPQTFESHVERSEPLGVYFGRQFLDRRPGFLEAFNDNAPPCTGR